MGFLDLFFKKPLGNINPDDPNAYRTAYVEYTQAQMDGDQAVADFFKRWNVKDEDHWSEIEAQMVVNGQHVAAAQYAAQAQMNQGYAGAGFSAPAEVDGIGIGLYAQMVAHLETAHSAMERETKLRYFGCDESRFGRIQAGFQQLMNPGTPEGARVAAHFQQHLALARNGG